MKCLNEFVVAYAVLVRSGHGQNVVGDPMRVETRDGPLLRRPAANRFVFALFAAAEHGALKLLRSCPPNNFREFGVAGESISE